MKKLYKLIKLKYENIIVKLIIYPWLIICLGILINITINITLIYLAQNTAIEPMIPLEPIIPLEPMIPYKHPMMLKLPTIKNICESYDDKIKMLTQNYDIQKLHTFIDNTIAEKMAFNTKMEKYIRIFNITVSSVILIGMCAAFVGNLEVQGFQIVFFDIEDTVVLGADLINNDLPFEAAVEIIVSET